MEIFDFAMKMELDGKAHYEKLAARCAHPGLRTIFLGLASDEQKHYDTLQRMKDGTAGAITESPVLDMAQNVFAGLAEDRSMLEGMKQDLDGYLYAMKVEGDSVRLYEDAAAKAATPDSAQLFLAMANEEKKHYNIMENLYDFVLEPNYFLAWREFSNLREL